MYSAKKVKNVWVLIIVMLSGIVVGGFLGDVLGLLGETFSAVSFLKWMSFGYSFGLDQPFSLDLGILTFSIGFTIKFTISGIIGMIVSVFVYKRI